MLLVASCQNLVLKPTGSFLTFLLDYFYKFRSDHGFPCLMAPHCQQDRVQTLGIHLGAFSVSLCPLGSRYQDGVWSAGDLLGGDACEWYREGSGREEAGRRQPSDCSWGLTPGKGVRKDGRLGRKKLRLWWSFENVSTSTMGVQHKDCPLDESHCRQKWTGPSTPATICHCWELPSRQCGLDWSGTADPESAGCHSAAGSLKWHLSMAIINCSLPFIFFPCSQTPCAGTTALPDWLYAMPHMTNWSYHLPPPALTFVTQFFLPRMPLLPSCTHQNPNLFPKPRSNVTFPGPTMQNWLLLAPVVLFVD